MKRILLGTLLALPFVISSLPSQASAAEVIVRPDAHTFAVARTSLVARYERRLIPAHWQTVRRGHRWVKVRVPARYVRVRV